MSETTALPTSPVRWFFGIAAGFAVFALVGVYSSRMAANTSGYDDEQAQERYAKLAKLQADDQKTLTTADWIDKDKGVARIPIDEALTEEVDALKARPVRMGDAIPGAAPTAMNTIPATNALPAAAAADTSKASGTNASPVAPAPPSPTTTK